MALYPYSFMGNGAIAYVPAAGPGGRLWARAGLGAGAGWRDARWGRVTRGWATGFLRGRDAGRAVGPGLGDQAEQQPGQDAARVDEVAEAGRRGQHEHHGQGHDEAGGGGRDVPGWAKDQ